MFYSQLLLSKTGPLGIVWMAAHCHKRLKKHQIQQTDISSSVDKILDDEVRVITHRILAFLLLGIVRIYSKKVDYLFNDCHEIVNRLRSYTTGKSKRLGIEVSQTHYHSISLPRRFELDTFDLDLLEDQDVVGGNVRSYEQEKLADRHTKDASLSGLLYKKNVGISGAHTPPKDVFGPHHICQDLFADSSNNNISLAGMEVLRGTRFSLEERLDPLLLDKIEEEQLHNKLPDKDLKTNVQGPIDDMESDSVVSPSNNMSLLSPSLDILRGTAFDLEDRLEPMELDEAEKEQLDGRTPKHNIISDLRGPIQDSEFNFVANHQFPRGSDCVASLGELHETGLSLEQLPNLKMLNEAEKRLGHDNPPDEELRLEEEHVEDLSTQFNFQDDEHHHAFTASIYKAKPMDMGIKVVEVITQHNVKWQRPEEFHVSIVTPESKLPAVGTAEVSTVQTPGRKERAKILKKRKPLLDVTMLVTNKEFKRWINDPTDLKRKRRNVPDTVLGAWRASKHARLPQSILEPSVSGISLDLGNLKCKSSGAPAIKALDLSNVNSPVRYGAGDQIPDVRSPVLEKSREQTPIAPGTPTAHLRSHEGGAVADSDILESITSNESIDNRPCSSETLGFGNLFDKEETSSFEGDSLEQVADAHSAITRKARSYLVRKFEAQKGGKEEELLNLSHLLEGKSKKESARLFYEILVLKTRECIDVQQEAAYRDILVREMPKLRLQQVSLFKRLLLMVRNLRAESDRMHALACICRTALCVDLFAKESVRRGQKPLAGTDIASLFEDASVKDDLNSITSKSLFREELVAMLVESCFQLSLPLPEQKSSGMESRVIGALAYGTGYGALNWTEPALEVVEVCRPCVKWDCEGRTYAIDCYLKLLVRLCHIYDTRGGVKRVKDGASQDQILNETRLQNLQRELIKALHEVNTNRICSRLLWAISEHIDLEGLDPLLADDPEDPLNIIISNIHKVLFNIDSSASTTNRLQDVQAVLLCAQRLGSRNARAGHLLTKELEEFRSSPAADSVNKHQCRLMIQRIKYVSGHPDDKWAGVGEARGDYPFSNHKLTVQFYEASAAQDRKLEGLIHKAVLELWRPNPNELIQLVTKGINASLIKVPPNAYTLTGSSDPCYVEGYHLADPNDGRITLHLKVLNLTEIELNRVDIRVGLSGGLYFMDGSPQAVRQLRDVNSQEPVLCSVTVGVSHFERCALWVQALYPLYEGDYPEEDPQIIRQKKHLRHELGEPVILRCQPYKIPLTELLLPHKISPVEYFRLWPSLPAIVECTGTYTYEGSGFKATAAQQYGESPFLSGLKSLSSKPFHKVCSHIIRTVAGFQLCYAAKTWYGGFVGMMIFGASEVSRNVDLGDETTTMICKFVVRASDASITKEIGSDLQGWMDDLTDGTIEYMPEDEVKAAAAERLKTSMERIALLKAARPRPKSPKSEEEEEEEDKEEEKENEEGDDGKSKTKGPTTLFKLTPEEVEHRALQVAVLQEWHMLCKDRSTKVN